MKIKICGIKRKEDILMVNEYLPHYIGFIFYDKSKRFVDINLAFDLKSYLDETIQSVGVFVNENPDKIVDISNNNIINFIQLHGTEDNNYIKEIQQKTKLPVIKAFRPDDELEDKINKTLADYILIDSFKGETFGGTGRKFDWSIIPNNVKDRLFLAGGINIDNVWFASNIQQQEEFRI